MILIYTFIIFAFIFILGGIWFKSSKATKDEKNHANNYNIDILWYRWNTCHFDQHLFEWKNYQPFQDSFAIDLPGNHFLHTKVNKFKKSRQQILAGILKRCLISVK
jgi:hypothetical protein